MDAVDLIRDLRQVLDHMQSQGQSAVTIAALEQYLAAQEARASGAPAAEQALTEAEHRLEVWKVERGEWVEKVKSAVTASGDALRTLVLINGGASVALLAFLGNVLTREPPRCFVSSSPSPLSVPNAKVAMSTFVFGVAFAGGAGVARYLSMFSFVQNRSKREGWFTVIGIALGTLSLFAFLRGGLWAYWAIR